MNAELETTVSTTNCPVKKNIRTKDVVDEIQKLGFKVKITHSRYFGTQLLKNADIRVLVKALKIMGQDISRQYRENGGFIQNNGGQTTVEITKDGVRHSGQANCSVSDIFNYAKASRLAIYRAVSEIPDLESVKKLIETECLKFVVQLKDAKWIDGEKFPSDSFEVAVARANQLRDTLSKETRVVPTIE